MPSASLIKEGLALYALALPFLFFLWLNHRSGSATLVFGLPPVARAGSPVKFWIAQSWLGFVVFCCVSAGTLIIAGVTPP